MAKYRESFNIELGRRLKARRIEMGYRSQERFAEAVGVSRGAVALWESGDNGIGDENYPAIKNVLKVGDSFFGPSTQPGPAQSSKKSDLIAELVGLLGGLDEVQLGQLIALAKTPRPNVGAVGQEARAPGLRKQSK